MYLLKTYGLVFAYLMLSSILLFFSRSVQKKCWVHYLFANCGVCCICLILLFLKHQCLWLSIFSDWLPLLLILFFYQQAGLLSKVFHQNTFDNQIMNFEKSVFLNNHPAVLLNKAFNFYWLSEFLHLCYLCYFFLLYGVPLYFYWHHDYFAFHQYVFAELLLLLSSFLTHSIIPVLSPRTLFEKLPTPLSEGKIYRFTHWIVGRGSAEGTAFPSTHVGIATLTLWLTWHTHVVFFYFLAPIALGLIISTVYGRFHYVLDMMGGIIYATTVFCVVYWLGV